MGREFRSARFTCTNDCRMEGCPGHEMTVVWERVMDTVDIRVDGKSWVVFDDAGFSTLVNIANEARAAWAAQKAAHEAEASAWAELARKRDEDRRG